MAKATAKTSVAPQDVRIGERYWCEVARRTVVVRVEGRHSGRRDQFGGELPDLFLVKSELTGAQFKIPAQRLLGRVVPGTSRLNSFQNHGPVPADEATANFMRQSEQATLSAFRFTFGRA